MALPVTFSLRGQTFTLALTEDQLNGIHAFIDAYNQRNFGQAGYHQGEFDEQILPTIPLYVVAEPEGTTWDDEIEGVYDLSLTIPGEVQVVHRDWSTEMLQGFITGALWLGVNWRDYATNITRNGEAVVINDHL